MPPSTSNHDLYYLWWHSACYFFFLQAPNYRQFIFFLQASSHWQSFEHHDSLTSVDSHYKQMFGWHPEGRLYRKDISGVQTGSEKSCLYCEIACIRVSYITGLLCIVSTRLSQVEQFFELQERFLPAVMQGYWGAVAEVENASTAALRDDLDEASAGVAAVPLYSAAAQCIDFREHCSSSWHKGCWHNN